MMHVSHEATIYCSDWGKSEGTASNLWGILTYHLTLHPVSHSHNRANEGFPCKTVPKMRR
jgi:hypothetical protein